MTFADILELLKMLGPAVAVYVGIRVDLARYGVRLDHIERDFYNPNDRRKTHHGTQT